MSNNDMSHPAENDLLPIEECIEPDDLIEAMVLAGAWAVIEASMDTADREPSGDLYQQTVADVRAWLNAKLREAAALGRRATNDPGAFVKRGPDYDGEPYGERLDQWQARAIEAALTTVIPPAKGDAR